MRTEILPSKVYVKADSFYPWFKSHEGVSNGNGMRDYYTHPSEESTLYTTTTKNISRDVDIKQEWQQRTHKTTPYKIMKEVRPQYLNPHPKAYGTSNFPSYKPLSGPLGAQYYPHPSGNFVKNGEQVLTTTYNHFYGKKPNILEYIESSDCPTIPSTSGYKTNTHKTGIINDSNKPNNWMTTMQNDYRPLPMNKSVCCLDINPNERCGMCDAMDEAAAAQEGGHGLRPC